MPPEVLKGQIPAGKFLSEYVQGIIANKDQIFKEWPDVKQKLKTKAKEMEAGFTAIQNIRNASLNSLREHMKTLQGKLNVSPETTASIKDEVLIPEELKTNNFLAPLMVANTGASTSLMNLLQIFGRQVVTTENQKLIQARSACFMIGDELCSPVSK